MRKWPCAVGMLVLGCGNFHPLDAPAPESSPAQEPRPRQPGLLSGRVLDVDGAPAGGVTVYIAVSGTGAAVATSNSDGTFRADTAPTGRVQLVLNDHRGNGLLRELVLFPEGQNDVGDLFMGRLENWPALVELRGIDYEERLTDSATDLLFGVVAPDGQRLYAARPLGGSVLFDVVELDLASGEEKVLQSNVPLDLGRKQGEDFIYSGWVSSSPREAPLQLLGGKALRVLITRTLVGGNGDLYFDRRTGERIAFNLVGRYDLAVWAVGDTIYCLRAATAPGGTPEDPYVDLYLLSRTMDAPLVANNTGGGRPMRLKDLQFVHQGPQVWMTSTRCVSTLSAQVLQQLGCSPEELDVETQGSASWGKSVYFMSMATPGAAIERLASVPQLRGLGPVQGEPASALLLERELPARSLFGFEVAALDLTTRAIARVTAAHGLWNSEAPDALWTLNRDPAPGSTALVLQRVRYPSGEAVGGLPLEVGERRFCQIRSLQVAPGTTVYSPPGCRLAPLPSGGARLSESFGLAQAPRDAAIADLAADGTALRTRLFSLDAEDAEPALELSADGTLEALVARERPAGFRQLWVGEPRGAAPLRQLTFLRADHTGLRLSPDGAWLYSFAQDPVSGRVQLFRIASPPPPGGGT